jgi:hypothetical protein
MYFMVESQATIGLGDITPTTTTARIALFFVAPGGIILLAVVILISRQTIIEEFEHTYKRRRALFKQKAAERHNEKKRNKILRLKLKRGGRGGHLSIIPSHNRLAMTPTSAMSSIGTTVASLHPLMTQVPATPRTTVPRAITSNGGRWLGGNWRTGFS